MTAGIQFKPLSNDLYSIPKAQILFKPEGEDTFELLGDADDVSVEPTVEETERYTNEAGVRLLAKTIVTQVDAVLSMTLVQLSDRNRALSLLGALDYAAQASVTAQTKNISSVDHNDKIYELDGFFNVSNVAVTDGATTVPYVLNEHYRIDASGGFIQFIDMPAGADGDAEITFDAPEVTSADEIAKVGIANKTENRGTVVIRGTNEVGPRVMLRLHDVQLRPSAGRSYISETDLDTIEVEGRVFRDENQATGLELGYEQRLP